MNYIKTFFKKYYIYMITFIVPIIIFILALAFAKFKPLGNNLLSLYDGFFQYPGFAAYLGKVLRGSGSLFYSFGGGLGTNFYGISGYYLFNPTSLLTVLFNSVEIFTYYEIIVPFKLGLCGLSTAILLKYFKRTNLSAFLFSMGYALCSYSVIYYSNYMWIDSLYLLPFVIIGINKLVHENNRVFYLIALSITIISNFYIGQMICIFSVIYFFYLYILLDKKKKRKKIIIDFFMMSLCSGLISAFILLPTILELFMGKSDLYTHGWTNYFGFDFDAITAFYKFTPGSYTGGDISYGSPNIYCSLLCIIYVIFSFFNKKFAKKEKILNLIIILYILIGFSCNLIDYSWQLFQCPIWYQIRYAFIFNLFLLIIASKSFDYKGYIDIKPWFKYLLAALFMILVLIGYYILNKEKSTLFTMNLVALILSLVLVFEYVFTINLKISPLFIILILILELSFNAATSLKGMAFSHEYNFHKITTDQHISKMNMINNVDNSFYRMEFKDRYIYNNGFLFDYNGVNFFSSIRNKNSLNFLDYYTDILVSDNCSINYNFNNPILNSFLGIKYIIADNIMYYNTLFENTNVHINNDALSLGFMVSDNIYNTNLKKNKHDYTEDYNDLIKGILNTDENFVEYIEGKQDNLKVVEKENGKKSFEYLNSDKNGYITYTVDRPGFYIANTSMYLYLANIIIDGNLSNYNSSLNSFIYLEEGQTMTIKFKIISGLNYEKSFLSFISYDNYRKFIDTTKANELNITDYISDAHLIGNIISTTEKSVLLTTIPYDKGWKVYVDDEDYEYEKALNNSFISLRLNPGEHKIEFKYTPRGLKLGIIISATGLLISIAYIILRKKKKI